MILILYVRTVCLPVHQPFLNTVFFFPLSVATEYPLLFLFVLLIFPISAAITQNQRAEDHHVALQ